MFMVLVMVSVICKCLNFSVSEKENVFLITAVRFKFKKQFYFHQQVTATMINSFLPFFCIIVSNGGWDTVTRKFN